MKKGSANILMTILPLYSNDFVGRLQTALSIYGHRPAFCIQDTFYDYQQLAGKVNAVRQRLATVTDRYIGLVVQNDLTTYASILAIWMEGKCYVPLHPLQPLARCMDIISQVGIHTILDSSPSSRYPDEMVILTHDLPVFSSAMRPAVTFDAHREAYILFTSGSTGRPKGVPITFGCVASFIEALGSLGIHLTSDDHCLQMFDLTFDLSVGSFLPPLLAGACVYTVGLGGIKWQEVFRLLDSYELTATLMVPSVIHYLRPYMDEIEAPRLRYSLFCGEALMADDVVQWRAVVPQARIWNVYGPTENTIYCTSYELEGEILQHNGIVSIGSAMQHTQILIVDDQHRPVAPGETGELCLAGSQLTPGYWKNPEKNREAFFMKDGTRWYLTGDLCRQNSDGQILYVGRKDSQVKIQGYRIELSEIEGSARELYHNQVATVALSIGSHGDEQLVLAIEDGDASQEKAITQYLKDYLPDYMIPNKVVFMKTFPQNANNKIDRRKIKALIE